MACLAGCGMTLAAVTSGFLRTLKLSLPEFTSSMPIHRLGVLNEASVRLKRNRIKSKLYGMKRCEDQAYGPAIVDCMVYDPNKTGLTSRFKQGVSAKGLTVY